MIATTSILIKEIDRFKSKNHKDKVISEYIVYTMADDTIIDATTIIGTLESTKDRLKYMVAPNVSVKIIQYENK